MRTKTDSCLKKNWVFHDRDNGITSVFRFVSKRKDGNFIVAVARGFMGTNEPYYSPGYGKKSAKDRMHRYLKAYNFTKNTRNKPLIIKAAPYKGKNWMAIHDDKTVFFVGGEEFMTVNEMEFWHERVLPQIEKVI